MHDRKSRVWLGVVVSCVVGLVVGLWLLVSAVHARDLGQWGNNDPVVTEWYKTLMQPDRPEVSCCGEGDAYWCDDYHVRDSKTFCKITDDRPDEPRKRIHIDVGTEIFIPDYKLKYDQGNPTGHSIVFLSVSRSYGADGTQNDSLNSYGVYCFVLNGGV